MSLHDYQIHQRLVKEHPSEFYAFIMAAMHRADSTNGWLLAKAFPDVWEELNARYNSPDGLLPDD